MTLMSIPILIWLSLTIFSMVFGNVVNPEGVVVQGETWSANLSSASVGIATIVSLTALAVAVGVKILGSGLSDVTVKTIILITGYAGVWGVLISLSLPLINLIGMFGLILNVALTILYVIGVVQSLGGLSGGGGE